MTSAQVVRLETCDQQVTGVSSQTAAASMHAACRFSDPREDLHRMVEDPALADRTPIKGWKAQPVHDGYESKLDLVIDGLPVYNLEDRLRRAVGDSDLHTPTTVIAPTPSDLEEALPRAQGEDRKSTKSSINIPPISTVRCNSMRLSMY